MELSGKTYRSFTPHRQEGITENPEYYSRNAYWKPPSFKTGDVFLHQSTGVKFKRMVDPSFLEHLGAGHGEQIYYMQLPSHLSGSLAREELMFGPISLQRIGRAGGKIVITITEFFLDGPRRKIGYVRAHV